MQDLFLISIYSKLLEASHKYKMLKRSVLKLEPCGTPLPVIKYSDWELLMTSRTTREPQHSLRKYQLSTIKQGKAENKLQLWAGL